VFARSIQDVDIWMEIPIQHDVYIWENYSVSSYSNFFPTFWNVWIWLKYDFNPVELKPVLVSSTYSYRYTYLCTIFPCTLTYNRWDHCPYTGSWIRGKIRIYEGKYGYLRANTEIFPEGHNQHWLLAIITYFVAICSFLHVQ
jgi:hypothetical protein